MSAIPEVNVSSADGSGMGSAGADVGASIAFDKLS